MPTTRPSDFPEEDFGTILGGLADRPVIRITYDISVDKFEDADAN
jgi:hypothetical protein